MPIINVQMLTGRTQDQKRQFIQEIAEATKRVLGVPEESIRIVLTDVSPDNWGVGSRTMVEVMRQRQSNNDHG